MEKRLQETAKRHMPKDQRLAHAIAAFISDRRKRRGLAYALSGEPAHA